MPALVDQYGTELTHAAPPRVLSADRAAREQARRQHVRAKYDAAQTVTDNERHWANADSLSAVTANAPQVRQRLRDRARYECANNTYAAGMVRTFATDVIGTGPRLQMQSGDKEADSQIEMAFWKWSVAVRLSDKLRTLRMAQTRDGEVFGIFTTNYGLRNPVKLDLRLYEAEQVAAPWTAPAATSGDTWYHDGIVFDDSGNPAAYHLLRQHPGGGDYRFTFEGDWIPARDVLHLFRAERPGQVRGIPEITPALPLYALMRAFTLATVKAARSAASISGYVETPIPDSILPPQVTPMDVIDIEPDLLVTLPLGGRLSQLRSEHPSTTYQMFKREIIAEIARVLGMPYNVAAGDSSSYNYSSGRLDHKTYYKLIRVDRSEKEIDSLEPICERWWEEARTLRDVLPEPMRRLRQPPPHTWGWDGDEHIDPLKEANAQQVRLDAGMTTYAAEYGAVGLDWEEQFQQRAREEKLRKELGLAPQDVAPGDDGESGNSDPQPRRSGRSNPAARASALQQIVDAVLEELETR